MSLFKKHNSDKKSIRRPTEKSASVSQVSKSGKTAQVSSSKKSAGATVQKELVKGKLSYRILMYPLMTEKINLQSAFNQYSFVVSERATKIEIKQAILETYGVTPLKVRTINMRGKAVNSGRGRSVYRKNWKKAIITLPADKKIDIYEGV